MICNCFSCTCLETRNLTCEYDTTLKCSVLQYSSQVTSWVHALRGMRACEKLARAQGALEELRAKPKPLESWTIANLHATLLFRALAQSWYSLYIKFTSQNIVTCSYNIRICTIYCIWLLWASSWRSMQSRYCPVAKVREDPSTSNIVGWNMIALVVLCSWQNVPLALAVHMVSHMRIV